MSELKTHSDVATAVERFLAELGVQPERTRDGGWSFRRGSARLFIRIREHSIRQGHTHLIVELNAPLLTDVVPTEALWKHVALHADNWVFGHLWASEENDGTATLILTHRLLGNFLDAEELKSAVAGLAVAADQLDNPLQQQFGGNLFHET